MLDPNAESYLDLDMLRRSFAGKQPLLESLINEYSSQVKTQLPLMHHAFAEGDFDSLEHKAHTLKGNSSLLCAIQVQELAKRIELSSRSRNSGDLATCLQEIEPAVEKTLYYLDALINERSE
jgi:HPt (histidine-containing phosphotransfer) domain-containing protein